MSNLEIDQLNEHAGQHFELTEAQEQTSTDKMKEIQERVDQLNGHPGQHFEPTEAQEPTSIDKMQEIQERIDQLNGQQEVTKGETGAEELQAIDEFEINEQDARRFGLIEAQELTPSEKLHEWFHQEYEGSFVQQFVDVSKEQIETSADQINQLWQDSIAQDMTEDFMNAIVQEVYDLTQPLVEMQNEIEKRIDPELLDNVGKTTIAAAMMFCNPPAGLVAAGVLGAEIETVGNVLEKKS